MWVSLKYKEEVRRILKKMKGERYEVVVFGKEGGDIIEGSDRLFVDRKEQKAYFVAGYKVSAIKKKKLAQIKYVDEYYGDWAAKNNLTIVPEDVDALKLLG